MEQGIPAAASGPASAAAPSKEERDWAVISHLSAMLMYVTAIGGLIAPLVIWMMKRDELPFVDEQAKETINFQISSLLFLGISCVLMWVLIGFLLFPAYLLFHFIITLIAAVKVKEGVHFRYPFCLRLLR